MTLSVFLIEMSLEESGYSLLVQTETHFVLNATQNYNNYMRMLLLSVISNVLSLGNLAVCSTTTWFSCNLLLKTSM